MSWVWVRGILLVSRAVSSCVIRVFVSVALL